MMHVKLKDWPVGTDGHDMILGEETIKDLERLVYEKVKEAAPDNAFIIKVQVIASIVVADPV